MSTGTLIITLLLSVLILLVLCTLYLLQRNTSSLSADEPEGENSRVLLERLQSRQMEIENLQSQSDETQKQLQEQRSHNISLREKLSRFETLLEEERKQHKEKMTLLLNAREQMSLEFKNLANEILEQKGKTFTDTNKLNIENILKPLNEKIQGFEKKVEETYDRESKERFSLTEQIKNLQALNTRISVDAVNLTNALKGESKTQGIWGEVILERVLEKSGLSKGREYEVQVSLKSEEGKLRQPDVVVHLPDDKDVIIDSKVSLSAYERYCSEEDESAKKELLKQHIQSIRTHIKGLSEKDYHQLKEVRSLDFVMMFLPVEAAFSLAVQHDSKLFTEAFDQNIILVAPSTLLATLRTIQNIWRYEHQNKNALEIAKRAGALYDKFVAFTEELEEVGQRLDQAQSSYENAHKRLSSGKGNVISQIDKLKDLGARASKKLSDNLLDNADTEEGKN
jgi:DNA recombination protein RmuC